MRDGVLPDGEIRDLMEAGILAGAREECVQPSSVDLTLSDDAFVIDASFLPNGETVERSLDRLRGRRYEDTGHSRHRDGSTILHTGRAYLFRLNEAVDLPEGIHAIANAKSSTGRLDVFARVIHDRGRRFDVVPGGTRASLWVELVPRSFPVIVRRGSRLTQMRFVRGARLGTGRVADGELASLLSLSEDRVSSGLPCHVDLKGDGNGPVGWVARRAKVSDGSKVGQAPVDVDAVGVRDPRDAFEPIFRRDEPLVLEPGRFYIFRTLEDVAVPGDLAAEMAAIDPTAGEFRAHYAGFFDPGFGWGEGNASKGVLEVRAMDVPFVLEHGQPIARLDYYRMSAAPRRLYGSDLGSNYQGQALRLSKHFKPA